MINKNWHVADFETTSYNFYLANGYTKVWLWAICDSEAKIEKFGSTIDEFIDYCRTLTGDLIYFHNLKFDGKFIIYYLLTHGYPYDTDLKVKSPRAYSHLISEDDVYYSIKINFSKNHQVEFQDSLKLLPFKVKDIAIDFELPILKGEWDYEDYTICEKSLSYIFNDVQVPAMAIKILKAHDVNRMTIASSAYHYYKKMHSDEMINEAFPELDDDFLTTFRMAYRGGRSMVNPEHQGIMLRGVRRYDYNSMYPYIMAKMELPYGYPIEITEPNQYQFELYHITIGFKLKEGHLPSLLKKGSMYSKVDSYYTNSEGEIDLYISNIDLAIVEKNYDVYFLDYHEMYGFLTGTFLFRTYVDKFYTLKQQSQGSERIVYKLMLNSLYGKFGSDFKGMKRISYLDDDELKFKDGDEEELQKYYLPMAIAITSYAHKLIDDAIYLTGIHNFVYCDTDSIHTLGTMPSNLVDSKELGKFKLEAIESRSKYIRQKTYITEEEYHAPNEKDLLRGDEVKIKLKADGKYYITNITCAGMPDSMKKKAIVEYQDEIFSLFKYGFKSKGKLMPKTVKGGCVLYDTTFEIK